MALSLLAPLESQPHGSQPVDACLSIDNNSQAWWKKPKNGALLVDPKTISTNF